MQTIPPTFRLALVLGGARSGKSSYALNLAGSFPGPRLFLATAEPGDEEMAERIRRHRRSRDASWETQEAPLDLASALTAAAGRFGVILVDCLTLWLSNLLTRGLSPEEMQATVDHLLDQLKAAAIPVVLVSNEVGWGLVPENPLAREFRDWAGMLHQKIAKVADLVVLTVAGLPVVIKGKQ